MIDRFLKPAACSELLDQMDEHQWNPSQIAKPSHGGKAKDGLTSSRTSSTIESGRWNQVARTIVAKIETALEKELGIRSHRLEEWQITRYSKREFYDFHLDCGCWQSETAGERRRTIMIYLDSPLKGGETFFRALNLRVQPATGRLLVWNNLLRNGNCDHAMIHAGLPVVRGHKTILITWERERRYLRDVRRR